MLVAVIIALKYTNFGLCVTCHVFFFKVIHMFLLVLFFCPGHLIKKNKK